jgi:hypothetical protein
MRSMNSSPASRRETNSPLRRQSKRFHASSKDELAAVQERTGVEGAGTGGAGGNAGEEGKEIEETRLECIKVQ